MFHKIGFIGTGNMGSAIALAVADSNTAGKLYLANRTPAKAEQLAQKLGKGTVTTNISIAEACDLIFLGVKPQMMPEVLSEITYTLEKRNNNFTLCTMAAGITTSRICEMLGQNVPVIRIMPNTPAAIGKGVIQICSHDVEDVVLAEFDALLKPAGLIDHIDEALIDAASAVSGCGPAFAYLFAEALADGGVACGLPRAKAIVYAAGMLEGAASLILESGKHPGELKDAVCSPAGTTIQGVRKLEEAGFRGAVMDAVIAAYEKTIALK